MDITITNTVNININIEDVEVVEVEADIYGSTTFVYDVEPVDRAFAELACRSVGCDEFVVSIQRDGTFQENCVDMMRTLADGSRKVQTWDICQEYKN